MTLIEHSGAASAPTDPGLINQLWFELTHNGTPPADTVTWHVIEHALMLADQGQIELAETCILELYQKFEMTLEQFFEICIQVNTKNSNFASTTIFHHLINNGCAEKVAYEIEISRCYRLGDNARVIKLFKKSSRWFSWEQYSMAVLFEIANSFMNTSEHDECFKIFSHLVKTYPNVDTIKGNLVYLVINFNYKPAREIVQFFLEDIAKTYTPSPFSTTSKNSPFIVDLDNCETSDIIIALHEYGLCHIKNACDTQIIERLYSYVESGEHRCQFPLRFNSVILEQCSDLLRFDPHPIVNAVLPTSGALDTDHCVVRKVDPGAAESFTPFHQDATAFHKAVVNIWTPLTPAGGDYPTIELVKRRLSSVEATLETSDGYNLVKIDDAEILRKYKDDLYEPTDVRPGECIIFLGTTIHRSTNLKAATKPRYNLEIRWS